MAVSVSRDLSVTVNSDRIMDKLLDRQQVLRESIQKGEPKALGVSQVMLGVLVITYSIPLLATEYTEVMNFGVPWWSGLSFIAAGIIAIVMERQANLRLLCACLVVTMAAILLSVLAVIFYFIDLFNNAETACNQMPLNTEREVCDDQHYATLFSRGVKSSLLLFTVVQTTISSTLSFLLYQQRRSFGQYMTINTPPTPTLLIPPDINEPITA